MASISSAVIRSGNDTSEYQVVRGHFGPLVKQCQHVLPNLANELFKKDLIGRMEYNAIIEMFQSTYVKAVNMMNIVLIKIEYNSSSFHLLVECLRVAGLNSIADDLETALSEEFTFDGGSRLVPKASLISPVSGSRGENSSEYKIVRDHFGPLVKQCQHVLASFANELFSRELITKKEGHNAIDNSQPIYNRVVLMLHSVLTKIENNSSCFHLLVTCLKMAELHSIADDLETALREIKNFRVIKNSRLALATQSGKLRELVAAQSHQSHRFIGFRELLELVTQIPNARARVLAPSRGPAAPVSSGPASPVAPPIFGTSSGPASPVAPPIFGTVAGGDETWRSSDSHKSG